MSFAISPRVSPVIYDPIVPSARKKMRIKESLLASEESLFELSLATEDLARKFFFETIGWESMMIEDEGWLKEDVYVISSSRNNRAQKKSIEAQVASHIKSDHPDARIRMQWVDIPKNDFFKRENFEKMEDAFCHVPLHTKICIHIGNQLITPKAQRQFTSKKTYQITNPDKVIVFDPTRSPAVELIFKSFQLSLPSVPHYYLTVGSSLDPFRRLTTRSQVYFYDKCRLVLQTPKLLTSRGFRIVHSLRKVSCARGLTDPLSNIP